MPQEPDLAPELEGVLIRPPSRRRGTGVAADTIDTKRRRCLLQGQLGGMAQGLQVIRAQLDVTPVAVVAAIGLGQNLRP